MTLHNIHIAELAERHNGILKAADLTGAGLDFKQIRHLTSSGALEKIGRGLYRFPQYPYDERLETARRIPNVSLRRKPSCAAPPACRPLWPQN